MFLFVISGLASVLTLAYGALWIGVADSGKVMAGLVLLVDLVAMVVTPLATNFLAATYTMPLLLVLAGHFSLASGVLARILAEEGEFGNAVVQGVFVHGPGTAIILLAPLLLCGTAAHIAHERGARDPRALLTVAGLPVLSIFVLGWVGVRRISGELTWNR